MEFLFVHHASFSGLKNGEFSAALELVIDFLNLFTIMRVSFSVNVAHNVPRINPAVATVDR